MVNGNNEHSGEYDESEYDEQNYGDGHDDPMVDETEEDDDYDYENVCVDMNGRCMKRRDTTGVNTRRGRLFIVVNIVEVLEEGIVASQQTANKFPAS